MKLTKETTSNYLSAKNFNPGDMVDVDVTFAAGKVTEESKDFDQGVTEIRLNVPIVYNGPVMTLSPSKSLKNDLIDFLGDETDQWDNAHIQLFIVAYPKLNHNGFVLRKQGCRKPDAKKPAQTIVA